MCLELLVRVVSLKCGHAFCGRCLRKCKLPQCPMCRAPFTFSDACTPDAEREARLAEAHPEEHARREAWVASLPQLSGQAGDGLGARIARWREKNEGLVTVAWWSAVVGAVVAVSLVSPKLAIAIAFMSRVQRARAAPAAQAGTEGA